jgi:PAS domain S-box-containing protein
MAVPSRYPHLGRVGIAASLALVLVVNVVLALASLGHGPATDALRWVWSALGLLELGLLALVVLRLIRREANTQDDFIRQQLDEIREKEAQYHAFADSGQTLIWTSGPDKLCQYFNKPWLRFTGRTLEQEVGKGWAEGVHPEDLDRCLETYTGAFDKREPFEMEYRLRTHSGDYRWIIDVGTPNYNLKGDFLGYIGHCYDIHDKRTAEEGLQKGEKLESLGVLAGGIAHDFNNLLAGIFAYLQLAHEKAKDEAVIRYLDKALGAFKRAKDLTRQLLTFSKGGEPVRSPADLGPVVEETTRFALSGSSVVCEFDFEPGLWPCEIDTNQIAQVVENLVLNAVQAMPLGGKLTITARNAPTPLSVRVSFTDTGIGIPAALLSKVFDPFFTTKQKGTGLGLTTSYSIVQKHGGTLELESVQGRGTTVHLTIPASTKTVEAPSPVSPGTHTGQGTILIMDDEDMVRELARDWLKSFGYDVVETRDGDQAIRYLSGLTSGAKLPVCAFLDLTIPGGRGGKETMEYLRPRYPELRAFASSGYSEDAVMARPREFGFTDSIAKPYLKEDLIALLNRHLEGSGQT